jgi:membrane-bound metal-dependent hydrolase YbcI (DUF457 family)
MFIGHFAVGLAAKKLTPKTNLAWLLAAPLFLDLLWPIFLLLGLEQVRLIPNPPSPFLALGLDHYPWSHSLVMSIAWSVGFGLLVLFATKNTRGAFVCALLVFSHWLLDFATHRPDMQLWPGSDAHVGLGLWYSTIGTLVTEAILFASGAAIYLSVTRARSKSGTLAIWSLLVFLVVMYLAATFGPPPPNAEALRYAALLTWILLPWALWIDRKREPIVAATAPAP